MVEHEKLIHHFQLWLIYDYLDTDSEAKGDLWLGAALHRRCHVFKMSFTSEINFPWTAEEERSTVLGTGGTRAPGPCLIRESVFTAFTIFQTLQLTKSDNLVIDSIAESSKQKEIADLNKPLVLYLREKFLS